jgi:flagellar hook-associated protein 3 FlgL
MNYRVTSSTFTQRAIHYSGLHSSKLGRLQAQISSGVQYSRASEQPTAFHRVSALRSQVISLQADRAAIDHATSLLNASVVQIQDFSDLITRARTLAQQGIQSIDSDERNALALEVDALLEQLQSISSARFGGNFLYGGMQSASSPFEFKSPPTSHGTLQVVYRGSQQRSRAAVGETVTVDTYYSGKEIFGSSGRKSTLLIGSTGAKPGSGTDTMIGRGALRIAHTTTNYLGSSGVQPGSDSASGDSILGRAGAHTLTIEDTSGDGTSGRIRLNGGSFVDFTNADTNLRVEGAAGQVVFVDTTSIAAGFSGTIDIEASGQLSADDGASWVDIDYSANQIVFDSISGRAVTIDSTEIRQTGIEHLEFPGTSNAFQVLFELANDLRNTRGLSTEKLAQALDRRLADLEDISRNVFSTLGEQSTSLQTLETLGARVDDLKLSVESQLSDLESTDLPSAVLQLHSTQSLLQYTYAVTAEMSSLGLLEFLR